MSDKHDTSRLTPTERITRAEEIWNSQSKDSAPLTQAQREELERRLAATERGNNRTVAKDKLHKPELTPK